MSGDHQQDLERNEPATAFKLEKARKRGSIVKSTDVTFVAILVASIACVNGLGDQTLRKVAMMISTGFPFADREVLSLSAALAYVAKLGNLAMMAVSPVIFVIWLSSLVAAGMQARGVFTSEPLKPDFNRLNPMAGFKRVFSAKSFHELLKTTLKLTVILVATVLWGRVELVRLLQPSFTDANVVKATVLDLFGSLLALGIFVFVGFAAFDWSFNRWDYLRQLRMSKRELKDEHKEREGDPRIKSRVRQLRQEWLKRSRSLAKVRDADVLLTNPTHYAVALLYRHGAMPAPAVTAKGAGEFAALMRDEARRRGVPIVQNALLTRALFAGNDRDLYVPESHFSEVARILRWVYAARRYKTRSEAAVV